MKRKSKKRQRQIKEVNMSYFLSRLYHDLRMNPEIFKICKLKKSTVHGDCDFETLRLDYRKDLYSTLVHEYLHYMFPDMTEREVMKEEKRIMNKMSIRQIKNMIKTFTAIL